MIVYHTKDGDVLDWICFKYYGHLDGTVEKVLEANPRLSLQPPVFSAGLAIVLPDIPKAKIKESVRLWS